MFIVIRQYTNRDGNNATALLGAYETEEAARKAVADNLAYHKADWESCGEGYHECEAFDDELYDGDAWDHDAAYKWLIFTTERPTEYWY